MLRVYATDNDGGSFSFTLTPAGQFVIDSMTGQVSVAPAPTPALDREVCQSVCYNS